MSKDNELLEGIDQVTTALAGMRNMLINKGFSVEIAEAIVLDWARHNLLRDDNK